MNQEEDMATRLLRMADVSPSPVSVGVSLRDEKVVKKVVKQAEGLPASSIVCLHLGDLHAV